VDAETFLEGAVKTGFINVEKEYSKKKSFA
jgi:hypothetical protein